jgi:hypothetical protein
MRLRFFLLVCAIALVARQAEGSAILFTDRAAFNAAAGDVELFTSFPQDSLFCIPCSHIALSMWGLSFSTARFLPVPSLWGIS